MLLSFATQENINFMATHAKGADLYSIELQNHDKA